MLKADESDDGVRVHILHHPTGAVDVVDCDAVIYATGFRPASLQGILGDLHHRVVQVDGRPAVSRDYRLATEPPTAGNLYIQGNTEHTHGLTSSLLSNIAVRSAEILGSIVDSVPADRLAAATGVAT